VQAAKAALREAQGSSAHGASSNRSTTTTTTTTAAAAAGASSGKKPVRVYMDGCFDMMHYGHSNALRQAKACGDILVVGIVSDAEVLKNKGASPVMNDQERYEALAACKWVDEIIRDVPYKLSEEWVDGLMRDHHIDAIIHGDDPCYTADGKDAYAYAKEIGVYKQVKRTEGVSTTDIVGRMLLMTKEHHVPPAEAAAAGAAVAAAAAGGDGAAAARGRSGSLRSSALAVTSSTVAAAADGSESPSASEASAARASSLLSQLSSSANKFLPTARRIMQFADGRVPKPTDRVVYVCGSWDLFNSGHIAALKEARKLGDFLLVGIHDDPTVNRIRGHGLPILNLYERTLSLLSCKYVDEVIIGAPWVITDDLLKTMNITVVAKGEFIR
jgi:ethanolamine-phosphate cytidylyltransferase